MLKKLIGLFLYGSFMGFFFGFSLIYTSLEDGGGFDAVILGILTGCALIFFPQLKQVREELSLGEAIVLGVSIPVAIFITCFLMMHGDELKMKCAEFAKWFAIALISSGIITLWRHHEKWLHTDSRTGTWIEF